MPDRSDVTRPTVPQLIEELDRLQEEQRTLDLRDSRAVDECRRKIDALRRKIADCRPPADHKDPAGLHRNAERN